MKYYRIKRYFESGKRADAVFRRFIVTTLPIVSIFLSGVLLSFIVYRPAHAQTPASTPDKTMPAAPATSASPLVESSDLNADPDLSKEELLQTPGARPVPPRVVISRTGVSDEIVTLSLDDAVRRGLENNSEIEIARQDVRLAESVLQRLEAVYDPVFRFNPQITRRVAPTPGVLTGSFRGDGKLRETDFQFDASAAQSLRRGGGSYEFFFNNLRRGTDAYLTQLSPNYNSNFGFTFSQPLLRDRAIDNRRREIKIQRKRLGQADADFRRRTIEIISGVQNAYWELVFALRDYQNRLANLDLAREQFRQTEARIVEGFAAPLERAEIETELARREAEAVKAARNVTAAENTLKKLILPEASAPEWSAQIIPADQSTAVAPPAPDLPAALEAARLNRQELSRLRLEREINEINVRYFKNQTRPQIDLRTSLTASGLAGTAAERVAVPGFQPLPNSLSENLYGGYGQSLGNLLRADGRSFSVGLSIEIPFRNRAARAALAGAQIQGEQLEAARRGAAQTILAEVRDAVQDAEAANLILSKMRASRGNAEIQLKGERQLFAQGRATLFLLFERQNQLVNARTEELRAETEYQKAVARLQGATGTTLQIFNVILPEE